MWARLGGVPPGIRPRPTDPFDRADLEQLTMDLTLELYPAALARVRKGGGADRVADVGNSLSPGTAWPGSGVGARGCARTGAKRGAPERDRHLRFWALVVADKEVATGKGERMQFITFEDETGLAEAVAFPDAIRKRQRPFRVGEVVSVSGRTTEQDGLAVFEVQ
jgi:hypothetical protein